MKKSSKGHNVRATSSTARQPVRAELPVARHDGLEFESIGRRLPRLQASQATIFFNKVSDEYFMNSFQNFLFF